MRYRYADVRASYSTEKARQERHDVMFRWFARPASFPVAWVALRIGLSPNHVTYLSLMGNAFALVLLASGSGYWMAIGVVIALLALVLDAADGNMARTARRFSPLGEWLEGVGAYLLYAGFHLAGGIGAWVSVVRAKPVVGWPIGVEWSGALVALGAIASGSVTVAALIAAKFAFVHPAVDRDRVVAKKGLGIYGVMFTVGRNLSAPSGIVLPLTLAAVVLRRYEIVLCAYAFLNMAAAAIVFVRCFYLSLQTEFLGDAESR